MKFGMNLRRIFAGLILALLLSASSLGAACDVSCAFASMNSDCHSEHAGNEASASSSMDMSGMAMPGMTMPEIGGGRDQQTISAISGTMAHHITIGEMGSCEKQACDSSSANTARTNSSSDRHFHLNAAATETYRANDAQSVFRGARDDLASFRPPDKNSLHLNLRV